MSQVKKSPWTSSLFAGRGGAQAVLPSAVRTALAAHEQRSEVLISVLQLFILTGFTGVYLLSPKPDAEFVGFMPVYIILPLYFAATLIRFLVARRRDWPAWALYGSCIIDVTFLLVLIWSFHLQYGQIAPFSLKAPTFVFLFLFIALRSLRLDPRYVIVTGLSATLGWLALVGGIVLSAPDTESVLTRSFVDYMTSNTVLIGAEIEKAIGLLLVTGVLALAVARGRSILLHSVHEEAKRRALSRFFDPAVAHNISQSDTPHEPGHGVRRKAAILNVDIRGFTQLASDLDTDDLLDLLGAYQRRVVTLVRAHGGVVDKFMGDGILITFGAVTPGKAYAADALRAIDAILEDARVWNAERLEIGESALAINCGVAIGTVIFGCVGAGDLLEYTVIGDAVNISAKLEKHNKALGTRALATRETYVTACSQGYQPDHEPVEVAPISVGRSRTISLLALGPPSPGLSERPAPTA